MLASLPIHWPERCNTDGVVGHKLDVCGRNLVTGAPQPEVEPYHPSDADGAIETPDKEARPIHIGLSAVSR